MGVASMSFQRITHGSLRFEFGVASALFQANLIIVIPDEGIRDQKAGLPELVCGVMNRGWSPRPTSWSKREGAASILLACACDASSQSARQSVGSRLLVLRSPGRVGRHACLCRWC
jgi:hypothetical protein